MSCCTSCYTSPCCCTPTACEPRNPQLYYLQGMQGVRGPLAFYRGAFDATDIYYDNVNREDVVSYGDFYWAANNAALNATNSWGTPTVGSGDWTLLGPVANGLLGGYNSFTATANITGNSTISPASANHTDAITVTGVASSRIFAVATTGRNAGDRCSLVFTLPATASIVITVRNATVGGTQLLPSEIYPSNAYTTDGTVLSLTVELYFDGTAWKYKSSQSPA